MGKFILEYAQFRNGQFVAWIDGGEFETEEAARAHAKARGFAQEGEDYMISGPWNTTWDNQRAYLGGSVIP